MAGFRDAPLLYRIVLTLGRPILNPYLSLEVRGLENVPRDRPAIIASNHLSLIDSLVIPFQISWRPVYLMGKAEYWESWRSRWFVEMTGVVPVERSGEGAGDAALEAGARILESGDLLAIYPEGTRSPDGRLYRGRTGPVRMAIHAGVPIIPCGIVGTDAASPVGSHWIRRRPVSIQFGTPLDFSGRGHNEDHAMLRAATDELMAAIRSLSGQEYVDSYASFIKSGNMEPVAVSR